MQSAIGLRAWTHHSTSEYNNYAATLSDEVRIWGGQSEGDQNRSLACAPRPPPHPCTQPGDAGRRACPVYVARTDCPGREAWWRPYYPASQAAPQACPAPRPTRHAPYPALPAVRRGAATRHQGYILPGMARRVMGCTPSRLLPGILRTGHSSYPADAGPTRHPVHGPTRPTRHTRAPVATYPAYRRPTRHFAHGPQ